MAKTPQQTAIAALQKVSSIALEKASELGPLADLLDRGVAPPPVVPSALSPEETRIVPPAPELDSDRESLDVWGFDDTEFRVNERGHVVLTGDRYELCNQELPTLLPWIRGVMEIEVDTSVVNEPHYPPQIPAPKKNARFVKAAREIVGDAQVSDDAELRLRHGHGQTQEEMWAIKYGSLPRVPDLIVWPETAEQVEALVQAAIKHKAVLIPYGGGTNVTDALRCDPNEPRLICSVDMQRMNRILWIDPTNRMAEIQAGAVGRHIQQQLARYGFTMGHEPDSVEFSTMGGWVATNASGMKKNRYGNIEDIVLDVHAVTTSGVLKRHNVPPRESIGIDPRRALLGSEGSLGIVTSATVKLFPLPEVQRYGSILFKTFEDGVAFMMDLTRNGKPPASIRLVDNLQFQFGMALKPASEGWKSVKSKLEKMVVTKLKGFDPDKMVAATLVFEGTAREVAHEEEMVYALATRHGGMKAGSENGRRGYQLTSGIAYIRDFVMKYRVIAESFETSVPWSQVLTLCDNVKRRVYDEHAARGLPGKPFITCRVTQVYQTGVAVYFYMAFSYEGVENPSEVYTEIEHAAREEILRSGGSLSHHHGVGKIRRGFLPDVLSPGALAWNRAAKQALDPHNVFATNNQMLGDA
ncbi:MAG: hypothetical protein RIT45_3855 [Pseudomonadota bacterium]